MGGVSHGGGVVGGVSHVGLSCGWRKEKNKVGVLWGTGMVASRYSVWHDIRMCLRRRHENMGGGEMSGSALCEWIEETFCEWVCVCVGVSKETVVCDVSRG